MSDIVTLNGYNIKDEKAVRSYESIAQMKADTKLKEGYHVKTKGYYEASDGGDGEYIIIDDETLIDDSGTIHVLNNGLRAKLIIKNEINVKNFGNINSINIQKAIDYAYTKLGGGLITIPKQNETIELEKYINIRNNCILDLGNNNYSITEDFEDKNDFCIGMNTENGSTWDIAYNQGGTVIRNGNITNLSTNKGIIALSTNCKIVNIRFNGFNNAISKLSYYTDQLSIINCMFFSQNETTNYQIRCEFGGDGLLIQQCHFGAGSSITTPLYKKAIYLYGCRGGTITDCINGEYAVQNCYGVSIKNCHIEVGKVIFKQSKGCSLSNTGFFWLPNCQSDSIVVDTLCDVSLSDITYFLTSNDYSIPQNDYYDISLNLLSNVNIKNITKVYECSNSQHTQVVTAPKIKQINENNVASSLIPYNKLSCVLSNNYNYGRTIKNCYAITFNSDDYKINSISSGNASFNETNDITYYYNSILYFDDTKMLGYGTHVEQSFLNNGKSHILSLSKPSINKAMIRVYRGTSSGSYNKYVDIPFILGSTLEDNGTSISGYVWKSRTAGDIDEFNECLEISQSSSLNCKMTNRPTKGTWEKGNIVYNSNPSANSSFGWICTQYGTAGTWKSIGTIES